MSREIKFRIWIEDHMSNAVYMRLPLTEGIPVMQFTGLKDKNGKEIYESDIVEYSYLSPLDNKEKSHIWVVEYENGMYWLRDINKMSQYDSSLFLKFTQIEVIGNVHEGIK